MRVEELARLAGATPRMVRHYDRSGLLSSHRLANGYRDFPACAVDEVQMIRRLLASGLTVQDVITLRPCLTAGGEFNGCDQARSILDNHITRLTWSIRQEQSALRQLKERRRNMTRR